MSLMVIILSRSLSWWTFGSLWLFWEIGLFLLNLSGQLLTEFLFYFFCDYEISCFVLHVGGMPFLFLYFSLFLKFYGFEEPALYFIDSFYFFLHFYLCLLLLRLFLSFYLLCIFFLLFFLVSWRLEVRLLIQRFSSFLVEACSAINFPLSTALAASQIFCYIVFILILIYLFVPFSIVLLDQSLIFAMCYLIDKWLDHCLLFFSIIDL